MFLSVVLVITLGRIEGFESNHLSDDGFLEDLSCVELGDVAFDDLLVFLISIEDHGAVLRAGVRSLAVELCRVMRNGEEDLQQATQSDLGWIINNLDDSACPVLPVLTVSYSAVLASPPE